MLFEPGSLSYLNLLCSTDWAYIVAMDVDWVCLAAVGFFLICQKGEEYLRMHHTLHVCLHKKGGI